MGIGLSGRPPGTSSEPPAGEGRGLWAVRAVLRGGAQRSRLGFCRSEPRCRLRRRECRPRLLGGSPERG